MTEPVKVAIEYPEQLSRGKVLLKVLFGWLYVGIPHGIILWLYGITVWVVIFFAFWAVLFTGRYPRGMFDFVVRYIRWQTRVSVYWMYLLRDEYPPFNGDEQIPSEFEVQGPPPPPPGETDTGQQPG